MDPASQVNTLTILTYNRINQKGLRMLSDSLKTLLASNFAYYLKAQQFHWNVEGPDFGELHEFFQNIYEDAYSAIDPVAEYIRYLDEYAPGSFERYSELTQIPGQTKIPRARLMIEELLANNQQMIDLLNRCFAAAEQENQQGIADFLAGRLSQHGKYHWQLRSYLKDARA
jgi:starvation-inducible DNA-binding protein